MAFVSIMEHPYALSKLGVVGLPRVVWAAAGAGMFTHLLIVRNVEVEQYLRFVIAAFPVLTVLSIHQHSVFWDLSLLSSAARIAVILVWFFGGLASSIVLYRAFFHPLRDFPGPFPARVTKFYGTWLAGTRTMYYKDLAKMHDKYGDFVRTGESPISIGGDTLLNPARPRPPRTLHQAQICGRDYLRTALQM